MKRKSDWPRFIYLTGCDGTGKSTQARLLIGHLRERSLKVKHVWLRYPFFFSAPFLFLARLRGLSWHEEIAGYRHGYWDFRPSWLMRRVFPWVLLADAFLAACRSIYLPLLAGRIIVCERFVLDMLVDLMVACADQTIPAKLPGRLYPRLIPASARIIFLDLDQPTIVARRPALAYDRRLPARLAAFQVLANGNAYPILSSATPVEAVQQAILRLIEAIHA
jgi:hypothetical protein